MRRCRRELRGPHDDLEYHPHRRSSPPGARADGLTTRASVPAGRHPPARSASRRVLHDRTGRHRADHARPGDGVFGIGDHLAPPRQFAVADIQPAAAVGGHRCDLDDHDRQDPVSPLATDDPVRARRRDVSDALAAYPRPRPVGQRIQRVGLHRPGRLSAVGVLEARRLVVLRGPVSPPRAGDVEPAPHAATVDVGPRFGGVAEPGARRPRRSNRALRDRVRSSVPRRNADDADAVHDCGRCGRNVDVRVHQPTPDEPVHGVPRHRGQQGLPQLPGVSGDDRHGHGRRQRHRGRQGAVEVGLPTTRPQRLHLRGDRRRTRPDRCRRRDRVLLAAHLRRRPGRARRT